MWSVVFEVRLPIGWTAFFNNPFCTERRARKYFNKRTKNMVDGFGYILYKDGKMIEHRRNDEN